jgi:hypothetical protein
MTAKKQPASTQSRDSLQETIAVILLLLLVVMSFSLQLSNYISTLKTNELLSTFQRTDTVKDEAPCKSGFVKLDGACYVTIGLARRSAKPSYDPQSDPNLCDKIKNECAVPPGDGPKKCWQTCVFP